MKQNSYFILVKDVEKKNELQRGSTRMGKETMSESFRVVLFSAGWVAITSIGSDVLGHKSGYNEGRRETLMDHLDRRNYVKVVRPEYDAGGAMPADQPDNTYCRAEWHHRDSVFPPPHWRDEVKAKLPPSEGGSCGTFAPRNFKEN